MLVLFVVIIATLLSLSWGYMNKISKLSMSSSEKVVVTGLGNKKTLNYHK